MDEPMTPARQMWQLLEPVHAVIYYAPEAFREAAALGYATDVRWPSYFAWRSAPLGAAGPRLVTATYYSFSPRLVAQHVPAVWAVAAPDTVVTARLRAVDRAFRALLGNQIEDPGLAEAGKLARRAAEAACTAGRPLASANADLPWPDEPHLQLWHAATVLREHRGDGHVATLLAAELDPCEALVSHAAVGAAPVEVFASREWTPQEWAAAAERLVARGWIDTDGTATDLGRRGRRDIERRTDALAAAPWETLGAPDTRRLAQLAVPVMRAVVKSGMLPTQSTLGLGRATP
jgi:helix-turn-helix protein